MNSVQVSQIGLALVGVAIAPFLIQGIFKVRSRLARAIQIVAGVVVLVTFLVVWGRFGKDPLQIAYCTIDRGAPSCIEVTAKEADAIAAPAPQSASADKATEAVGGAGPVGPVLLEHTNDAPVDDKPVGSPEAIRIQPSGTIGVWQTNGVRLPITMPGLAPNTTASLNIWNGSTSLLQVSQKLEGGGTLRVDVPRYFKHLETGETIDLALVDFGFTYRTDDPRFKDCPSKGGRMPVSRTFFRFLSPEKVFCTPFSDIRTTD